MECRRLIFREMCFRWLSELKGLLRRWSLFCPFSFRETVLDVLLKGSALKAVNCRECSVGLYCWQSKERKKGFLLGSLHANTKALLRHLYALSTLIITAYFP